MLNFIIEHRRVVHIVLAAVVMGVIYALGVPLLWVMGFGSLLGIILGKTFCRWLCPMGVVMCGVIGGNSESQMSQQYQYFKIGCPISWISGFLNRLSLFKVKREPSLCVDCGKCDKVCYITTFDATCSLYKDDSKNPSQESSCSRCLECVRACPTQSLKYKV